MRIEELDYHLPPERIATHPADPRDHSRLLVYRRADGAVRHHRFFELPELLAAGDLLVVNDTKVVPAKLLLRKPTGAFIPGLFVEELALGRWKLMLRSRGKLAVGDTLLPADPQVTDLRVTLQARASGEKGQWIADVTPALAAPRLLERIGHVPLPPYIEKARRDRGGAEEEPADRAAYQTVYADPLHPGSVAAPTAGLHFTPAVLARLAERGIARAQVTLHVGLGTFLPVETDTLEAHPMHTESYVTPATTAAALRAQRAAGRRIVVVGTTACRTLEAAASRILDVAAPPADIHGTTDLLISPGYPLRLTDALLTNFHLPRSTLLALVAAMTGLDTIRRLYAEAIAREYRFYSYGDAMLIE